MRKYVAMSFFTILCAGTVSATVVQLDISSAFNYDAVGTALEDTANPGGIAPGIGDHNVRRQASWGDRTTYVNQGSVADGTALPDNGQVGAYQMSTAYDNGTDGLTKSDNSIGLYTTDGGSKTAVIDLLSAGQDAQYSSINLLFSSWRQERAGYRSYITAGYSDASSVVVVETPTSVNGAVGGTFGGAEQDGHGGFPNTTDTYSFVNQAPGTGETIGHESVLVMDRRMTGDSTAIGAGTAVMWQFDSAIALDPTKTLTSLTITMQAPASNVNREGALFVYAINATAVPEPSSLALLGIAGFAAVFISSRRRRRC